DCADLPSLRGSRLVMSSSRLLPRGHRMPRSPKAMQQPRKPRAKSMARPRKAVSKDRPLLPARPCKDCGKYFEMTWKSARCYDCYRIKQRERCWALQMRVYQHYSNGRCECCGESHHEFLTLDHIG